MTVENDIVTFHPKGRLIKVRPEAVREDGVVVIDAIKDIYSAWKRWAASEEGIVFGEIVRTEGGVVLPTGFRTDVHVIMQEGWRIQCPDNAQTVQVYGNLHSADSDDPFASKPNGSSVVVNLLQRKDTKRKKLSYNAGLALLVVGILLFVLWIIKEPTEIEPYATLCIVLFTLLQFWNQGEK